MIWVFLRVALHCQDSCSNSVSDCYYVRYLVPADDVFAKQQYGTAYKQ
jgi:hypothetical protein